MAKTESKRRLNLVKVVDHLLKNLSDRERTILLKRYGFKSDKKHTLEQIGNSYNITRERVRQIENNSINKLKNLEEPAIKKARLDEVNDYIYNIISQNGGVLEESVLIKQLHKTHQKTKEDLLARIVVFVLNNLVEDVNYLKPTDSRNQTWKVKDLDEKLINGIIDTVINIISKSKKPLSEKDLLKEFYKSEFYQANENDIISLCDLNKDGKVTLEEIFVSYLQIISKIRKNIFDKWGLTTWKSVQPKKINDKAYLVLKKAGKPLHFTEITQLINKSEFDEKVACPATVHNELILNDQYVLVGRGIYALKEWGFKEGTVIDVIYNILAAAGNPMNKDDIVDEVLKTRMVKKSTIYLSLLNKNKFQKVGFDQYTVK